jgi:hypothetical protein
VRKLKIFFTALVLISSFALLLPVAGCKKTYNTVVQDSVSYSAWQSFGLKFEGATTTNDSVFDQTVKAKSVTQAILDKGSVLVYIKDGAGDYAEASSQGILVILAVGQIYLETNFTTPSDWKFRYVIIPGNVATQSQARHLSYSDASRLLNLSN